MAAFHAKAKGKRQPKSGASASTAAFQAEAGGKRQPKFGTSASAAAFHATKKKKEIIATFLHFLHRINKGI